jgi:hypothetical protein
MSIMAADEMTDMRRGTKLMTETVLKCLQGTLDPVRYGTTINGMWRLLAAYRAHGFAALENDARRASLRDPLSFLPAPPSHVTEVRVALEAGLDEVFGERDTGVDRIKVVLKSLAYPDAAAVPDPGEREKLSQFLTLIIGRL